MKHSAARRFSSVVISRVVLGLVGSVWLSSPAAAQIAKLGAMGDSLTDEYAEETYNYAKNWLEQLELHRAFNVGPTAAEAGQSGGTWGEPRRRFFKHNWARSGATTSTVISAGQHTGLAGQFASDGVSHAVLLIGANDFSPTTSAFFNIYNNNWSQTTINNYINGRLNNMNTIINTVSSSGVNLAVSNFVDYSVSPLTRVLFPDPVKRERVSVVVRQVNDGIEAICRNKKLPMVDVYGLSTAIFGTNLSLRPFLFIGGQDVNLNDQDTTSNTKKLAAFVHDGVHPHTTLQGVFSNVFMTCANIAWQGSYVPFTEQEILSHAGVAYLGVDELPSQIGDYAQYVVNFACLADFDKSGFVDSDDFDAFVRAFEAGESQADYDGSGFVDTDDFDAFVEGFEVGC
jgi:GDSL-like Lipase/Acylhydrolase family